MGLSNPLIMVPSLEKIDAHIAHAVNNTMLLGEPARPGA
jgi:hypothetical protein